MSSVIVRAGCFVAIIIIGWVLRRVNFFQEGDFKVVSKIVLRITLPAAIIYSFSGKEIDPSMLMISGLGFGFGAIYVIWMFLMNLGRSKEQRAFYMLNTSGYNISNFTMPFAQSFLGPLGVITTSLFDAGNAVICLGGAYSVASLVQGGESFSINRILKPLFKSAAFDAYMIMTILALLHIRLPEPVTELAGIIGNANAFLAMLMLGIGFHISGDRSQIGAIVRILSVRYCIAIVLALACFFLLPLDLEYRRTLVLLVFSPIGSAAPAFTVDLHGDTGLASVVNSISIVISLICIVAILILVV